LQTTKNSTIHTYKNIGNYTAKVSIKDANGRISTKTANIRVASPRDLINTTLTNYKRNINKLNVLVNQYPSWQAAILKNQLTLNNSESKINELTLSYNQALITNSQSAFIEIMKELQSLYVPESINTSSRASGIPFDWEKNSVFDKTIMEESSSEEYPDSRILETAINGWVDNNMDLTYDYTIISGYSQGQAQELLILYKIRIKPLTTSGKAYLVINDNTIILASNYSEYRGSSFLTIPIALASGERTIEFAASGIEDYQSIPFWAYPEKSLIDLSAYESQDIEPCNYNNICESEENNNNCPSDCKNNTRMIIYIVLVLLAATIIYILMMWWYRNKYASHLFKNRADYANIMTYVSKSDRAGVSEEKIRGNLKKSGWKEEQIDYAIKKYNDDKKA
jgi:hypothetical protein